jgi:hypothetical protein
MYLRMLWQSDERGNRSLNVELPTSIAADLKFDLRRFPAHRDSTSGSPRPRHG